MSFWQDRLAERRPAQPQAPQTPRGSWWQPPAVPSARPQEPISAPASPERGNYTPDTSARLSAAEDRCPRCGSEDYVEVPLDVSYGGRAGIAETGVNLGKSKRCFSCRYPSFDSSGTLVRKGSGAKAEKREVKQLGGGDVGSWGDGSWDNAQLIA